ncbi:tRNA (adenine(37)-N6)-methyltransferase isoform X2 [Epargyreus clarus]
MKYLKDILDGLKCSDCASDATTVINQNNCNDQSPTTDDGCIPFRPIGYIHTIFENKRGVPRQPSLLTKSTGTVVIDSNVFSNPAHALEGLEEFSHMWLLYHFHKTEGSKTPAKVTPPRLGERRGVLSTRSPHRPCPIGMSLVKIQAIEGNKIHFLGIDMVDGTPLLDIKPYIPQYDYPAVFENASRARPPIEGISDILEPMNTLGVDEQDYNTSSVSPRLTNQIGIDTASPASRSPYDDEILSPDNQDTQLNNLMAPLSPSSESPSSVDLLDGAVVTSPTRRLDTERGAPDGQERFTPPQSNLLMNANQDGIRIASWIANPPSQRYHVMFNDDTLERLHELIGARAESFKTNIECLLSEDPRSLYVRTRYPDHEYSCVLEDLSISCSFDATAGVCTIIAVRSAEELQEN